MFSWSNNNSSNRSTYPGQRGYTRQQHIDSYIQDDALRRSTRRVSQEDDSRHDTVFQTVNGDTLVLRVTLPVNATTPSFKLVGVQARHPWLDPASMNITTFGLTQSDASERWAQTNLLLGKAIHQVIQHLQLHPPEILAITDPALEKLQKPGTNFRSSSTELQKSNSSFNNTPPDYDTVQTSFVDTPLDYRKLPTKFEEIENMSKDDLKDLLNDELEFIAFVNKLSFSKELRDYVAEDSNNVEVAKQNLAKKEELALLHEKVSSIQKELLQVVEECQELEKEQHAIAAPPDPREIRSELNQLKKQSFAASEEMAETWLDDGGDVADFLASFLESRKQHHTYAAKMELL